MTSRSLIQYLPLVLIACLLTIRPAVSQDDAPDFSNIPGMEDGFDGFDDGDFGAAPISADQEAAFAAASAGMFIAIAIMSIIGLVLTALVAYLMMDALNAVPEQYRQLSPMVPWLLFVPLVNLVVVFLVFIKVPESLSGYLNSIGNSEHGDCGKNNGLIGCILYIIGCTFPIGLVLMVMSILKINKAKQAARSAG